MAALLVSLSGLVASPARSQNTVTPTLDVPYLPQTEALCGGAAAAMLFRFWGDAHASVQQFAPLVDREAGGIADTALIQAIRERHWSAVRLNGSVDLLRRELAAGRPPMLLIEDRPQRYHYVIVVGITDTGVLVHDPTWGPARTLAFDKLEHVWKPSGYWMLRVTPESDRRSTSTSHPSSPRATDTTPAPRAVTRCDELLDAALDDISAHGTANADAALSPVIAQCPDDARPLRELAGVRFSQQRWAEAAALADDALHLAPRDHYAADVLGSSRFMLNDFDGALRAWNINEQPQLDSVRITGLSRTRYSLLAQALDLPVDSLLTADAFRLARRRLESMPDLASTRLSLRPAEDGYAVADIAVVERATLPHNVIQWVAAAGQAALEREVDASMPGRTGQGETWSAAWGWWENRPRVSMQFAAPLVTGPRGVWRVNLGWESQAYGPDPAVITRERHLNGEAGLSSWITAGLRGDVASGLDAWTRTDGRVDRTVHVAAAAERRLLNDHISVQLSLSHWFGIGAAHGFGAASIDGAYQSRRDPGPIVAAIRAGASTASANAPLALWSGAGEGRGRGPLLRAHTLLDGGRIDGPVFGRRLGHGTVELQHWTSRPHLVRIGVAAFTDAASAGQRAAFAQGRAFQVDSGAGLRVRVPGRSGVFRIDYAHGLRDGADAWLIGWQLYD